MKSPTIYIVTPCRNAAKTINETITSVVTQQGSFFIRYHIQDCNSSDETLEILEKWRLLLTTNSFSISCLGIDFTYASEQDSGLYDGVKKGFEHCDLQDDNAFMTYLNADDILINGAFSSITDIQMMLPDIAWVTGRPCQYAGNSLVYIDPVFKYPTFLIKNGYCESRFLGYFIQQEGTFWKVKLWNSAIGINADLKFAGDFDLWVRFARQELLWIFNGPLGVFRVREGQLSENLDKYFNEINSVVDFDYKEKNWQSNIQEIYTSPDKLENSSAEIVYDYSNKKYIKNITEFPIKNYISIATPNDGIVEPLPILNSLPQKRVLQRLIKRTVKYIIPYGLVKMYQNRRH